MAAKQVVTAAVEVTNKISKHASVSYGTIAFPLWLIRLLTLKLTLPAP